MDLELRAIREAGVESVARGYAANGLLNGTSIPSLATSVSLRQGLARKEAGEPVMEIARDYNVSHSVISRLRPEARL